MTPTTTETLDYVGYLADRYASSDPAMPDGLRLTSVPLLPEIKIHLADDAVIFWARLEADSGGRTPAPFWASAWPGGKALARFVLDRPDLVAGRTVLDVGSGSGIVAIAAALAGGTVTANDVDPRAIAAITLNAHANEVDLSTEMGDLSQITDDFDVILAGDMLYSADLAEEMLRLLRQRAAQGATVLIGDPDRGNLHHQDLRVLATYPIVDSAFHDAHITHSSVFQLDLPADGKAE